MAIRSFNDLNKKTAIGYFYRSSGVDCHCFNGDDLSLAWGFRR